MHNIRNGLDFHFRRNALYLYLHEVSSQYSNKYLKNSSGIKHQLIGISNKILLKPVIMNERSVN